MKRIVIDTYAQYVMRVEGANVNNVIRRYWYLFITLLHFLFKSKSSTVPKEENEIKTDKMNSILIEIITRIWILSTYVYLICVWRSAINVHWYHGKKYCMLNFISVLVIHNSQSDRFSLQHNNIYLFLYLSTAHKHN